MKKFALSFTFVLLLVAGCFAQQGKVVLKAGTEIRAQLETIIDVAKHLSKSNTI